MPISLDVYDGRGGLEKARELFFDEGIDWVRLKLEANLFMQVCVCVCACADLDLASSAVVLKGKTTVPNSLEHHQPGFQPHDGGGLGNGSRPPTQKRKKNNIQPLKQVLNF